MEIFKRKILFVINRKSGTSENAELEVMIQHSLESRSIAYERYYLTGVDDKVQIIELIDRFDPDIVCAAGGDGTVNLVASIIMNSSLTMGIIPIGSANGLAVELGISERPEDALNLIINSSARPIDVVQIDNGHISLHLSDVGFNARIVSEFEKEGKRGFKSYVKHFFKEVIKPQKSFRCEIVINNKVHIQRSFMTVIANASKYRTGANLNPTGKIDDGVFEVIVFKPYHRWKLRSLLGAFTGTMHKQPHVETFECESAEISIKPPQKLQVDGESLGITSHFKAEISKHALKIILP
jgi:YegS/Rv2252/BmrU family lipid kinase